MINYDAARVSARASEIAKRDLQLMSRRVRVE